MRKAILLVFGIGTGCLLLLSLCINVTAQLRQPESIAQTGLPGMVSGTFLQVQELVCYEGPFWEDGSALEVTDIAAVVIQNMGGCYIEQGAVILEREETRYVFEISWLPPGAKAMVLEKHAQRFESCSIEKCYGWVSECYPEGTGAVQVEAVDDISVALRNRSPSTLDAVCIYYKHYDTQRQMYIGGITYCETVCDLSPGGTQIVSPWRYVKDYSKIVCVLET